MQGGTNGREVNVLELRPFAGYTKALSANRINRHPLCVYVYFILEEAWYRFFESVTLFHSPSHLYTIYVPFFFSSSAIDLSEGSIDGHRPIFAVSRKGTFVFPPRGGLVCRVSAWIQQQWRVLAVAGIGRKKKKGEERKKKGMMGERPLNGTTFRGGRSTGRPYDVILHAHSPATTSFRVRRSARRPGLERSRLLGGELREKSFYPLYNRYIEKFARPSARLFRASTQLVGCEAKVKGDGGYRWIGYRHARRRY